MLNQNFPFDEKMLHISIKLFFEHMLVIQYFSHVKVCEGQFLTKKLRLFPNEIFKMPQKNFLSI